MAIKASTPARIIAGGQTGAEQGALRGAQVAGIPTGGWSPLGYKMDTAGGSSRWLKTAYGCEEHPSPKKAPAQILNAQAATVVVWYGQAPNAPYYTLAKLVRRMGKPFLTNPSVEDLRAAVEREEEGEGAVVYITGTRERTTPGLEAWVWAQVILAWGPPESEATARLASPYRPLHVEWRP